MDDDSTGAADSRALGATRRAQILAAIRRHGTARVADLAAQFGVTPVTVRRDLADLDDAGLVTRVHGGAVVVEDQPDPTSPGPARRTEPGGLPDGVIGMLVPSLSVYWPDIARSVERAVRDSGMRLLLHESRYEATDERPDLDRLVSAGCVGILAAPTMQGIGGERAREWLRDAPVPVVLVERTAVVDGYRRAVDSVISDHTLGGEMAAHHLADLGHEQMGMVFSTHSPHAEEIQLGWRRALHARRLSEGGVLEPVPDRAHADFDGALAAAIEKVIATRTTALLVHSDPEAVRLVQHAETRGLRVPEDLAVISYDDEIAALASPPLTALRPQRQEVGRAAVAVLLDRVARPDRPVHRVAISPTLVVRESTTLRS